jgi:2-isopropylmalate synthase
MTPAVPDLYDTTLRDGVQGPGMALTTVDKLEVARLLDALGVAYIEGGWPGAIPRDTDFFRRAADELTLHNAVLAAFGATRRPDRRAARDPQVTALLAAETPVVTLVAKSDSRHVERALRTTRAVNLAMVEDTVRLLVAEGREVFVDAEHFFDGFLADQRHALDVVRAATQAGASAVVLCDTNGGSLPATVAGVVAETVARTGARLGIHCHDDTGCAVANTLAALDAGAVQAQGTAHGYGERCGNANLFTLAANLVLKRGSAVLSAEQLAAMSGIAAAIARVSGVDAHPAAPYVGAAAFAHKAGLHASALRVDTALYQHVEPERVGNRMRMLVSDMAGRASVELKAAELGYDLAGQGQVAARVVERIKADEHAGLSYEAADASFELVLRAELGAPCYAPFAIDDYELSTPADEQGGAETWTRAVVTLSTPTGRHTASGAGLGAVAALDDALARGLRALYPGVERGRTLVGHEARALGAPDGPPLTRVHVTHGGPGGGRWTCVAADPDPTLAALRALRDAHRHMLLDVAGTAQQALAG